MSKTLGNGIDPMDIIEQYGADSLRYSVISGTTMGNDIKYMPEKLEQASNFANKIWNAAKFIMMNMVSKEEICEFGEENYNAKSNKFKTNKLKLEDKWILSKLDKLVKEVTINIENYDLGVALDKICSFIWNEFCDWYIEIVKPRLYSENKDEKISACYVLSYVFEISMKLLHPFMPFVTEKIYSKLYNDDESIMISEYPTFNEKFSFKAEEEKMESASLAEEPEWTEETEESKTAEMVTSETTTGTTITLYAIWEKATEYKITYKLNKGKNSTSNPKTYTGETEIKLKKPTRSGYHFVGWYTDSKYKQKIDVIEKGSKGRVTLYAKWIKEVNPSAKAASLTALKGTKAKTITASANIANYVKSVDDYYYLLYVDSNSGKVKKAAAKVKKPEMSNGKVAFKLDISGHPEYTQGKFAVGVKKSKTAYTVISSKSYVSNPEKLSSNTAAYFVPKTKKGIQATNFSEVTDTKSKNVFFNLYISDLMRKDSGVETYKYNGKTYHFNGLYGYEYLVQQCNAKGIQVTAQISIDKNASTQSLTTGSSPYAETAYYGWNTDNAATRQTMEAMFAYLGEKFGRNNCYISNWILGNEVNSASGYYYVGNVSFSKFISMYSEAFRCLYNAVRSSRGSSKVFICLDNCWNQKNAFSVCYSAKSTLDNFATKISEMQKNVNWNLAYHAYNQPLSDPRFWSGANASMFTSDANSTTFITMRNIDTLTSYVKSRYGSNTRVILSEQGFSSTGGQANQAAALALAYYKAACNPMIDAFIVRSYKDEAHEVAQGLAMGLKDANGKKKTAFNVFSNMDSSNSLKYTEKVLSSQVGNWKAQIPGYNVKRISSMYRK